MSSRRPRRQVSMRVAVPGAELCVDMIGDPDNPAVLLIMGAASSMDRWEAPFCERLAAAGRFVIRYDHRDTGASTTYPPGEPGYEGDDLIEDALAVLDAAGVARAHLAGMSMGGAIAQRLAVEHAERVLSLTVLCATPAGSGGPELPPMSAELQEYFSGAARPEPDWSDRDAAIAYLLEAERPWAGRRGIDDEATVAMLERAYHRSPRPASANNHFLLDGNDMPFERLGEITVPTLVIHGSDDPMRPLPHGEALAASIPEAQLLVIDGLGHEFPRWAWAEVLPALVAVTG
jgi:pimeloyl-ACP methyl ester carboxylesterase